MKRYDELIEQLKNAKTEEEKQEIESRLLALKAFHDAYTFNAKQMELLS